MKTILVVDDDAETRDALACLLELEGYETACVASGRDALERLARGPAPSLVLMDLWMPDVDGRAFRAAQRMRSDIAAVPVVFLTGSSEPLDDLGACACMRKPADAERILEVVRAHAA